MSDSQSWELGRAVSGKPARGVRVQKWKAQSLPAGSFEPMPSRLPHGSDLTALGGLGVLVWSHVTLGGLRVVTPELGWI